MLPLLEILRNDEGPKRNMKGRPPSVLVLAPTRELANQVRYVKELTVSFIPSWASDFFVFFYSLNVCFFHLDDLRDFEFMQLIHTHIQVHEEFKALLPEGITSFCVYGGAPYEPQEFAIRRGLDILVGTPGRILDHMGRDLLNLSELRWGPNICRPSAKLHP